MNRVELVYDSGCPNVAAARDQIREALSLAALSLQWQEWDRDGANTPEPLRHLGSPTILVDGRDVSGTTSTNDSLPITNSCRIYTGPNGGLSVVPALELIVAALRQPASPGR